MTKRKIHVVSTYHGETALCGYLGGADGYAVPKVLDTFLNSRMGEDYYACQECLDHYKYPMAVLANLDKNYSAWTVKRIETVYSDIILDDVNLEIKP